jgi:hypothetical protein
MCTPRCAITSHGGRTRAISLMESHDRIAAQEPGPVQAGQGRKPAAPVVHSASLDGSAAVRRRRAKRSWLRAYCSLGRNTRGAHSLDCSMSCAKPHAVMLSRTLRHVSDLAMLFCRPTVPHAAAFILPSLGRRSALRRPCAVFRQTAIRPKPGSASCQHIPCRFVAVGMPTRRVHERASCVARSTEARMRELRRLCPLFAERAQEGGKQTGLSRMW